MFPRFDSYIVFAVMGILVALFAWIYLGDRHARVRLWLLGWIAMLIHYAAQALFYASILSNRFLLSVSEVFSAARKRYVFLFAITFASLAYLTALIEGVQQKWFFIALLLASSLFGLYQAIRFYGWRSPYLYALCLLLPYAGWVIWQAQHGDFWQGLYFYLFGFFAVTGLAYYRHFLWLYSSGW